MRFREYRIPVLMLYKIRIVYYLSDSDVRPCTTIVGTEDIVTCVQNRILGFRLISRRIQIGNHASSVGLFTLRLGEIPKRAVITAVLQFIS